MRKLLPFIAILFIAVRSNAQKKLITFSAESGGILPIPIFYEGINTSFNENIKIFSNIGTMTQISCTFNFRPKSNVSLGLYYESFGVHIKQYLRFPSQIDSTGFNNQEETFEYSHFDSKNFGFRVSFGNTLGQAFKLNAGFQYGFPLNKHYGYIYEGHGSILSNGYHYETKNPFSVFANVGWQMYQAKKYDLLLVPEFVFQINKDDKTYLSMNQIRKLYFALRVGISLK